MNQEQIEEHADNSTAFMCGWFEAAVWECGDLAFLATEEGGEPGQKHRALQKIFAVCRRACPDREWSRKGGDA